MSKMDGVVVTLSIEIGVDQVPQKRVTNVSHVVTPVGLVLENIVEVPVLYVAIVEGIKKVTI